MTGITRTLILALIPLILIEVGLLAAGYIDLARRERVHGEKWMWALIMLISFIGPILYFTIGREE